MSEIAGFDKAIIKLQENNFDLNKLYLIELEILQKYAPAILEGVSKIGEVGLKSQEKVLSTIDRAIEIFSEQLKDPNLSQEARDNLNDRIERMVDKATQTDSGFKKWMVGLVWVGVGGGALALAGTNPEMRKAALKLLNKSKPI